MSTPHPNDPVKVIVEVGELRYDAELLAVTDRGLLLWMPVPCPAGSVVVHLRGGRGGAVRVVGRVAKQSGEEVEIAAPSLRHHARMRIREMLQALDEVETPSPTPAPGLGEPVQRFERRTPTPERPATPAPGLGEPVQRFERRTPTPERPATPPPSSTPAPEAAILRPARTPAPRRRDSGSLGQPPRQRESGPVEAAPRRRRDSGPVDAAPRRRRDSGPVDAAPRRRRESGPVDAAPHGRRDSGPVDAAPRRRESGPVDAASRRRRESGPVDAAPHGRRDSGPVDAAPRRRRESGPVDAAPRRRRESGPVDAAPRGRSPSGPLGLSRPARRVTPAVFVQPERVRTLVAACAPQAVRAVIDGGNTPEVDLFGFPRRPRGHSLLLEVPAPGGKVCVETEVLTRKGNGTTASLATRVERVRRWLLESR